MRNQPKKRWMSAGVPLLAGLLMLMAALLLALPAPVSVQAQGYPGPGTATVTTSGYPGPGTATVAATTPAATAGATAGATPVRTPTQRILVPDTGGEIARPPLLGGVDGGVFVALWLVGLLLVGYGLLSYRAKR